MSLSVAEQLAAARRRPVSNFEAWVDSLDKEDKAALLAAAADPTISVRVIYEIAKTHGVTVGREKISLWRKVNGLHS